LFGHIVEHREMTLDDIRIGRACTIGCGAVLLNGVTLLARSRVADLAMVLKRDVLLADHTYRGSPAKAEGV